MKRFRALFVFLFSLVPVVAGAATTDFRVLFDVDNDVATGCTVAGMAGVDQVLTTRLNTTETAASVTRTMRQVCSAGSLGAAVDLETTGWPAGFQPNSGSVLVETRYSLSLLGSSLPSMMRIGIQGEQGAAIHTAIVRPDGSQVMFPRPAAGKRRSVGAPGTPRTIVLDGQGNDWTGLDAILDGIAASGTPALRLIRVLAYTSTETGWLYFNIQANLASNLPFAADDDYERQPGSGLNVPAPGVLANDSDPNGQPLTATPISPAARGTVTLNPDGSFTYTPDDPSSTSSDAFEYKASNGSKDSNAARVRITVANANNDAPNAANDAYNTDEDELLAVPSPGVLQNDTDSDGDVLTATLLVAPQHGTVVLNANGGFTYTPASEYSGDDTFTYSVSDGTDTDTAVVSISIASTNDEPSVGDHTFSVAENSPANTFVGTVTVDDADAADTHTFSIESGNTGGAFAIDPATGDISVDSQSALDFETGPTSYSLVIRATDSGAPTRFGENTIVINVTNANDAPVAASQTVNTTEDTPVGVTLGATDQDGDTLTYTVTLNPSNGSLSGTAPNLTYTPNPNFNGTDSFSFRANDGTANSNTATVTINVSAVNDAPVNTVPGAQTTNEDASINFGAGIQVADIDAASVQVTIGVANGTLTLSGTTGLTFTTGDGSGDASMTFTGTTANVNAALNGLVYLPNANFSGSDSLGVTTNDLGATGAGGALADTDNVSITVNAVNDAPVNNVPGAQSTSEDAPLAFTGGSTISISDSDAGAGMVRVTLTSTNGTLTLGTTTGLTFSTGDGSADTTMTFDGTLTNVNAALATLSYTPNSNYTGGATVTITTDDLGNTGGAAQTDSDAIAITVVANNDAPVNTVPGAQTTDEDTPLAITGISVADPDAGTSAVEVTLSVTNGTFSLASTTGLTFTAGDGSGDTTATFSGTLTDVNNALASVTYAPAADFNGTSTLTITTSDLGNTGVGGAMTDTDNVSITVTAVNDAPVNTTPAGATTNEDTPSTFGLSIDDTDDNGGMLEVTLTVTNGTLTLGSTGGLAFTAGDGTADATMTFSGTEAAIDAAMATITFTPAVNFNGTSTVTIVTNDNGNTGGGAQSDTDSFDFTVVAVNDAPVNTVPGAQAVDEDTPLNFGAGFQTSDLEATTLQATLSATSGTLTLSATSGLSFSAGDGSADATMTFSGATAAVNAALTGLQYWPNADYNGSDTVSITTSDLGATGTGGTLTDTDNVAITVNAVNDAPINAMPGAQSTNEDVPLVLSGANAIQISDVDAASGNLRVTLAVTNGTVTLAGTAGLSFVTGDGTNDASLSFDGTVAAINAALDGMIFTGTPNFNGPASIGITTSDLGNSGSGGALSDTDTLSINVIAVNDAPVAVADSGYTLAEGGTITAATTVLGNDTDTEGSTLNAALVSGPANASAFTLHADGTFDYTHNGGETIADSFSYRANDGSLDSNTVTVSIVITPVNDAPVAVADSGYSVAEGGTITGGATVLGNDTDAENDTLNAVLVSGPANDSSFTLNADGTFNYTHDASETTTDSFTYKANDGTLDSTTVTVSITVTAVNDAPVAVADSGYSVAEGGTITGATTVLANDTDAEGSTLTATLVSGPANDAAFTLHADGTFDYTHDGSETSADSFTYKAHDGTADSNTVTVTITVTAINDAPVAVADSGYTVAEGGTITAAATVLGNDTDGENDTLTAMLVSGPSNDSGFTLNADGTFDYTHDGGETTTDSFTYKANDGTADSNTVTVTIAVTASNDAPVATADGYTVAEGGTLTENAATGVLANDTDPDSTLTAVLVSGPANSSTFALNADGSFNYTHDGGETTTDSFTYKANDGTADSNTVTVTITVTAVNDAPVAVADSGYTLAEGGNVTGATTVLGNDTDAEGDTLTATLVSGPTNSSSFTLNSDGTFDYTHNGGETTADSFTYKANDGTADSNTVTVSIVITPVNDAPVAVADSGYTVNEGAAITGAATVLTNDTDAENDTLTAMLVSGPSNDSAFTLNSDGTFDYTHDGSETTTDSFTYKANDGTADSNTVTVTITVTAVNDAPVAVADSGYTFNEGSVNAGASSVLANDTDAEGNTLTATLVSGPSNDSAFVLNSDGTFDYTHDGSETTSDSFTYKANDGTADSNTVTVSIAITAINDAPVAVADSGYAVNEGGTITGAATVLGNDTDGENDTLTAMLVSGPSNDSAFTLNSDGTFDYTHDGSETTSDSFTYKANDGTADSNTVTVTIVINAINDAPVAVADSGYSVGEGGTITGAATVLGNDTDAENDILTAMLVSGPSNDSAFTLNADGTFDYTHDGSETTSDSFTYKANDGAADSNTVTVTITVTAVNDAPVAVADSGYAVNEAGTITGAATVLANDTDGEGDTLTATLVSGPSNDAAFALNADGTFDYTHDGSETTSDSFTYKANDGAADSNTVTVTITINPINDAPVATDDSGYSVDEGGTITGAATVLGNDTDAEAGTLTATLVSGPANSSAFVLNSNGTFDYTHNGGETTTDSFTYKANDGTADSNTVTVTITVDPVNDIPSFTKGPDIDADSAAGAHTSNPWAMGISSGTGETQNVNFVIDSNDNAGLFTVAPAVNSTGALTFTPVVGATGIANITLHIEDDGGTDNGGTNASATQSFIISLDSSPTVNTTDPAEAGVVATNKQVTVTFNEAVTLTGTWFQIACGTSGTHDPANSTVGGGPSVYTITTAGFSAGETCAMTIFGAQVTDDDTIDPPNLMSGNAVVNFTIDAAPTVTGTTPTNGAIDQKTDLNIVITFSEAVTAATADFTLECPVGGAQAFSASGTGTNTITLNPTGDLPAGTTCTVKVLTSVVDLDAIDPPNGMAAQYVFSFTTDAQPAVTTTSPVDESIDNARGGNITINFSEPVDASVNSFTIKCPSSGTAIPFAFVGASTNTNSIVLNPNTDLPDGERCEVTIFANQINDTDTNDPPANLVADVTFQFGIEPNADDDSHPHTIVGNILSNTDGLLTVVTNDDFPAAFPITALTYDATSVNGGTVVMNNTIGDPNFGEYTYNPGPGFEGTDTFTYTITTANGSDTGTVSVVVSGMVWFIDANDAVGPFDGRLGSPFNTLAQFEAVNGVGDVGNSRKPQANDHIFLYQSGTAYVGPVALENGQKLIGQDSTTSLSAISGLTPASSQAAFPGVNSGDGVFVNITSATNGVVLAQNNQVRGLRFGTNTGMAISGTNFGTLFVRDALVNNSNGGGFTLNTGAMDVVLASFATTNGTHGLNLTSVSGSFSAPGAATISNPTTAAISITGLNPAISHGGTISITNGRPGLLTSNMTGGSIALNVVNVSNVLATTTSDAITLDGNGSVVDLSIASATINTSTMDDGVVLSDLASGSDVILSAGSITSTGANRRVFEVSGNVNCNCNLSAITLSANSTDGISLGATHLGTYTFGDLDVNTPNGGIGVQVVGDIDDSNVDSSVTFKSIDIATCSQSGILVHSHSGSFSVTGTGAANSGGTISGCTQRGAKFGNSTSADTGAKNITLTQMVFNGNGTANLDAPGTCGNAIGALNVNCAANIDLQNVVTASFTNIKASNSLQMGINGRTVSNLTLTNVEVDNNGNEVNEDGVQIADLTGTMTWTGINFHDNASRQLEIQNGSGVVNLTINGTSPNHPRFTNLTFQPSTRGQQGVLFSGHGTANMTMNLQNAVISRTFSSGYHTDIADSASANVTVNNATLTDVGSTFNLAGIGSGSFTYAVTNSTMYQTYQNSNASGLIVQQGEPHSGTFTGTITGNTIGDASIAGSAAPCDSCNAISVRSVGRGGTHNVTISGNTIQRTFNGGIYVFSGKNVANDTGTTRVKILSNIIRNPDDPSAFIAGADASVDQRPIHVENGALTADTTTTCADILNNVISDTAGTGSWDVANLIRIPHRNNQAFSMPGYAGSSNGGGAPYSEVVNYLNGRNNYSGLAGASASVTRGLATGTFTNAGANCF
jgi:VCBS repeat-containing protein